MPSSPVITGLGAVSPAGWGMHAFIQAILEKKPLPTSSLTGPTTLPARLVPRPVPSSDITRHPRLRRASPLSHFAAAAALEALGPHRRDALASGTWRLGLIYSLMNGCVAYSGKFYREVLADPATASPILFPETVFNAPASHLATLLGLYGPVATLIGDPAQFLASLEIAQIWMEMDLVDACLVVGAEEADWLTAHALHLLSRGTLLAEGAGAVLLEKSGSGATVRALDLHPLSAATQRPAALRTLCDSLPPDTPCVIDDTTGHRKQDAPWATHPHSGHAPLRILGQGFGAAAAWQTVLGAYLISTGNQPTAEIISTGLNQQAGRLSLTR